MNDLPAILTRARTDIHYPICGFHRLFIVFNNDESISEVAQAHQRVNKPPIVALMQADGRLIEHV